MNNYQKSLIRHILITLALTLAAVGTMINLKDLTNRSEAIRAMRILGGQLQEYRKKNLSLPSETVLTKMKENLPGSSRLGDFQYRAVWINYDSPNNEILAYAEKNYKSLFVKPGYIVLRLGGEIEWMKKKDFENLLQKQQSPKEFQFLNQQIEKGL